MSDHDDHDHDDCSVIAHDGVWEHPNGEQAPARLYHSEDEPCLGFPGANVPIDESFEHWNEGDVKCFRRVDGRASSVGASKKYSSNYDSIDWGN